MLARSSIGIGLISKRFAKHLNIRSLQTSVACRNKVADDITRKRPVTLDRELPDPFIAKRQERRYFWTYAVGVTLACAIIFNYEKTRSPIINSTLYFLRRSSIAKSSLGEEIDFNSSWPWIWGTLNTVKGNIDISFEIKGSKGKGTLKLKANRSAKLNPFDVSHFLLIVDGKEYDLTKDSAIQFDI